MALAPWLLPPTWDQQLCQSWDHPVAESIPDIAWRSGAARDGHYLSSVLDDHSTVEQYCNAVAAEVLLPAELLDQTLTAGAFSGNEDAADEALRALSNQLHVSQAALLIRLRDRGEISQATYEAMEKRRSTRRGGGRKPGGQYYAPAINRVGRLFAHRVVDALTTGTIDRQDASVLLGVGEHLIPTYLAELAKGD